MRTLSKEHAKHTNKLRQVLSMMMYLMGNIEIPDPWVPHQAGGQICKYLAVMGA